MSQTDQPEKLEILFVDDDQFILDALRASLRRQRKRWNMRFALGGAAGIAILEEGKVDCVVTDMRMPEFSGKDVLQKARQLVPEAVRIVMSGQAEDELTVAAIPYTHQWLSKPTETSFLVHTIERTLVTRDLVHAGPARAALGTLNRLPMMPRTYQALTEALASEEASVDVVTSIVAENPSLSLRVLQMANSAFFGLSRRLDDVREAVGYLGFKTIAQLVFAAEVIHEVDSPEVSQMLEQFQAHAILSSRVAAEIMSGDERATTAGTAAMLHDIGLLGFLMDETFQEAIANAPASGYSTDEERKLFGTTHADLGGALLGVWGLSSELVEAVAHHHEPQRVELLELDCVVAVHVAQAIVREEMLPEGETLHPSLGVDQELIERLGLTDDLVGWRTFAREAVQSSMGSGDAAQEAA